MKKLICALAVLSYGLTVTALHYLSLLMPRRRSENGIDWRTWEAAAAEVDQLLQALARLNGLLQDTFEDRDAATRWMNAPNQALGGKAPKQLLGTTAGIQSVYDVLLRIEYGVMS